jgi:ketosteroid isomerase-like protein
MKKLLMAAALIGLGVMIAGNGAWGRSSGVNLKKIQREASLYEIDKIERTWHKAASTKNLKLMMSTWAPNATFTIAGQTYRGKAAIRGVFVKAGPFQPQNHWESDTATYKIRTTVNGNKGTLYFECHYVDVNTQKVVAAVGADQQVQKINGRWLITKSTSASVTLKQ